MDVRTIRPEQELDPERLLSPGEMARRWGISRAMVYDLLGEGCPSLKIGRARRLRVSDADAWLAERQALTS